MNASARTARAIIRQRAKANRLTASTKRRPRSLATYALATGADRDTAAGCSNALRTVAKRLNIEPVRAIARRTVEGGRQAEAVPTTRYTREQVRQIAVAYKPRKPEYKAVRARLLDITAA